jgi:AbrB family looped-hinge helix DNA binding protein
MRRRTRRILDTFTDSGYLYFMVDEVKNPRKRRRGMTRVSAKHQITLPVAAMREAGIEEGDELSVRVDGDGRLALIRERDRIDQWIGAFPGLSIATDLEGLRDEWER